MQHFREYHHGDLTLSDDLEISSLVSGTVTVPSGRRLLLRGVIAGDLIVEQEAHATIHGTVNGVVLNHGGDVEIFGTVDWVRDFGERKTFVDARAVIRKSN